MKIHRLLILVLLMGTVLRISAQMMTDVSYVHRFYFAVDKSNIDESLGNNYQTIDSILYKIQDLKADDAKDIKVHIYGSASLEASDDYNSRLSSRRAQSLIDFLSKFKVCNGVEMVSEGILYDFSILEKYVMLSDCPRKEELVEILQIPSSQISMAERKLRIQKLDNGNVYKYMYSNFFKYMRHSRVVITAKVPVKQVDNGLPPVPTKPEVIRDTVYVGNKFPYKGVIGIRSNLLFDAGAVPNIGVDVYVSKNISVGFNWMYTWIKSDKPSNYWRVYGGDIHCDYWFDPTLMWDGHHVGVYAQMSSFDFELGGRGYQGPKWLYGGGISYGYSWWLSKHFSLDFGIGVGYLGGKIYEYTPSENKKDIYYLEKSRTLNWIGPTKAEVSLIWKIGNEFKK